MHIRFSNFDVFIYQILWGMWWQWYMWCISNIECKNIRQQQPLFKFKCNNKADKKIEKNKGHHGLKPLTNSNHHNITVG